MRRRKRGIVNAGDAGAVAESAGGEGGGGDADELVAGGVVERRGRRPWRRSCRSRPARRRLRPGGLGWYPAHHVDLIGAECGHVGGAEAVVDERPGRAPRSWPGSGWSMASRSVSTSRRWRLVQRCSHPPVCSGRCGRGTKWGWADDDVGEPLQSPWSTRCGAASPRSRDGDLVAGERRVRSTRAAATWAPKSSTVGDPFDELAGVGVGDPDGDRLVAGGGGRDASAAAPGHRAVVVGGVGGRGAVSMSSGPYPTVAASACQRASSVSPSSSFLPVRVASAARSAATGPDWPSRSSSSSISLRRFENRRSTRWGCRRPRRPRVR